MNDISRILLPCSRSDNRKSKTCTEPFDSAQDKLRRSFQKRPRRRRWVVIFTICFTFVVGIVVAWAQPKEVSRIGYLAAGDPTSESIRSEPIRLALRELGYIEGQNIAIEYRYAEGKRDRAPALAAELVRLKVDVIVVTGRASWVRAAKNATKTIPIVMVGSGNDPVEEGLVESLARPGGNVTGLTLLSGELGGKRLELLKEAVPKVARVAVLYDPADPSAVLEVKEVLPVAARTLGLTVQPWEVRAADDFEQGIRRAKQAAPGWTLCARREPANDC